MPTSPLARTRHLLTVLAKLVDGLSTIAHSADDRVLLARHARTLHHALYTLLEESTRATLPASGQLWLECAQEAALQVSRSLSSRWGEQSKARERHVTRLSSCTRIMNDDDSRTTDR